MTKNPKKRLSIRDVHTQLLRLVWLHQKVPTISANGTIPKEKLTQVQETIDCLRVYIKYDLFEIESLRREIEWLTNELAKK